MFDCVYCSALPFPYYTIRQARTGQAVVVVHYQQAGGERALAVGYRLGVGCRIFDRVLDVRYYHRCIVLSIAAIVIVVCRRIPRWVVVAALVAASPCSAGVFTESGAVTSSGVVELELLQRLRNRAVETCDHRLAPDAAVRGGAVAVGFLRTPRTVMSSHSAFMVLRYGSEQVHHRRCECRHCEDRERHGVVRRRRRPFPRSRRRRRLPRRES